MNELEPDLIGNVIGIDIADLYGTDIGDFLELGDSIDQIFCRKRSGRIANDSAFFADSCDRTACCKDNDGFLIFHIRILHYFPL